MFSSRVEYRALEGFVLAVSPFNFTAIGGNLSGAPALVGNVVVWKPSPMATYANYITHQLLLEAGVPPGVIQFCPGPAEEVVAQAISHPSFAALHFTGSTFVFKKLWRDIAANLDKYKGYPRIVGETGKRDAFRVGDWPEHAVSRREELSHCTQECRGQKCRSPDHSWRF